jgi:O-antigen/teichoic acid export membrane protein
MANEDKLMKDTMLYAIANFGSKIILFLMLPLYTRYFTPAEYGLWDLVVTTAALLAPLVTFELVSAVYRWLLEEKHMENKKSLITTGAITILRNLIIFNVLAAVVMLFVSIPFGWLALLYINVTIVSSFIQQCARGLGYNKLFALIGIIQTVIMVAFILLFIFVFAIRIEAFFYASIIAGIGVVLYAWRSMQFSQYIAIHTYSKTRLKSFLVYSIPIIPGAASWWVMTMSDRYFITAYLGMDANGIYAVANKIPAILLMMNTVFLLAWKDSAILTFDSQDKNAYYSTVFQHFFRLMATTVICLTLVTKPVLAILIDVAYYSAWKYIGILLLATLLNACALFWAAGYHGAKKTNTIFITSLIGAVINVLFNLIFIQMIGLYAVVLSTFLAFFVTWLIRVFSAKRYFTIRLCYRDVVSLSLLMALAIIIPFITNQVGLAVSIGLGGLLFIGYNWKLIRFVWRGFVVRQ